MTPESRSPNDALRRVHELLADPRGHRRPVASTDFTDKVMAGLDDVQAPIHDAKRFETLKLRTFAAAAGVLIVLYCLAWDSASRGTNEALGPRGTVMTRLQQDVSAFDPERALLREWTAIVKDCESLVAAATRCLPR